MISLSQIEEDANKNVEDYAKRKEEHHRKHKEELAKKDAEKKKAAEEKKKAEEAKKAEEEKNRDTMSDEDYEKKRTRLKKDIDKKQQRRVKAWSQMSTVDSQIQDIEKIKKTRELTSTEQKKLDKLNDKKDKLLSQSMLADRQIQGELQQFQGELEQSKKYKNRKAAEGIISQQLQDEMQQELDVLKQNGKVDEMTERKMRAIIRAHKTVEIVQSKLFDSAVSKVENALSSFTERQTKMLTGKASAAFNKINAFGDKVFNTFDNMYQKFSKTYNMIDNFTKEGTISKAITDAFDSSRLEDKLLGSTYNKVDKLVGRLTGQSFNSKARLAPVLNRIKSTVGKNLENRLKPMIEKHVKQIEKIAKKVATFKAKVFLAQKKFKTLIKTYEDKVKNFIQEKTKAIIGNLAAKGLRILGGMIGGKLGGMVSGIKLGF